MHPVEFTGPRFLPAVEMTSVLANADSIHGVIEFVGGIRRLFAASTNGARPMVDALSLIPPTIYLKHSTLFLEINGMANRPLNQ